MGKEETKVAVLIDMPGGVIAAPLNDRLVLVELSEATFLRLLHPDGRSVLLRRDDMPPPQ